MPHSAKGRLLRQVPAACAVAKKDAVIDYLKPPVVSFGVIFPILFCLAFAAGRDLPVGVTIPGIVSMALFFTASAVGPLVAPWERQAKTREAPVTSPASLWAIVAGDVSAGMAIGALLSPVPIALGVGLADAEIAGAGGAVLGATLGAPAFSSLGVLMAAPATDTPAQVMMLSNLARLPLIFVSGVFVPLAEMPAWGRWLAPFPPLSYSADLIRGGFGGAQYFSTVTSVAVLLGFSAAFLVLTRVIHRATQSRAR